MIKNAFRHFKTITKHKILVFKFCCKCGIIWQGIVHDLSKYSPTEFLEGAKYFHGDKSPIVYCKKKEGYSKAWLHHVGHNKHHHEYWYDYDTTDQTPIMPYKCIVEMICDNIASGMTYQGKNWTNQTQFDFFNKRQDKYKLNDQVKAMLHEIFSQVKDQGIDKVITKENIKKQYKIFCLNNKE